jgi:hypothetical protein
LPSTNNNQSSPIDPTNLLMSLINVFQPLVNQNDIGVAKSSLGTNTANVSQLVPGYSSTIDVFEKFGDNMVPADGRVYYRCKACDKCVWVAKEMSAFTEFPACFNCQKQWLSSLGGSFQ